MSLRSRSASNGHIDKPRSTTDDQSSSSSYPSIRRRISKACNYCRQRKIKCNGNTPCVNCKNHSIECTYSKTMRKKKKQAAKKLTLQDLEKRMNKMDQKFEFLSDKITQILTILKDKNIATNINNDAPEKKKRGRKPKVQNAEGVVVKEEEGNNEEYENFNNDDDNDAELDFDDNDDEDDEEEDNDDAFNEDNNESDEYEESIDDLDEESEHELRPTLTSNDLRYPLSPVDSDNSNSITDTKSVDSVITPPDNFSFAIPPNDNKLYPTSISNQQLPYGIDGRPAAIPGQFDNFNVNALDVSDMQNKLNLIYGDYPTISSQLESELY